MVPLPPPPPAFLQGRLRERDPERLRERHGGRPRGGPAEGEPAEAVRHLLEAGEQEGRGRCDRAGRGADGPDLGGRDARRMARRDPAAALAGAPADRPRPGRPAAAPCATHEAAFAEAEEAIERLIEAGDHARAATAIVRLQQTMITAGTSPRRRWESGERYRDRIAPDAPMLPVVRILLAAAYGYGGRFAEARDRARGGDLAPPRCGTVRGPSRLCRRAGAFYVDFWTGRPLDALRALEARDLGSDGDRPRGPSHVSASSRGCSARTCCSTWADSRRPSRSPTR